MKTKKTGNPANTIKYVLAGIGVIFLAVVISVLTFHEPTPLSDNTTEPNHDNVFTRDNTGVVVSISPDHPNDEISFLRSDFALIDDITGNDTWSSKPPNNYNRLAVPDGDN
jgi:hypothetical protein